MTTPTPARGPVAALLLLAALVLLPLLIGLFYVSQDTLACFGQATACRGQRAAVMSVVHAAMALVAGPCAGAALLGLTGAALNRRAAVWAATGALLGAMAMWIVTLHVLAQAFSQWEF
ncbi:hypothetical protein [Streptomyces sp. NPDC127190]|uniref:hypothetical protein n=1 Tax=unclassified Streptomyces TaxID=2593676 RepID=UPI0036308864